MSRESRLRNGSYEYAQINVNSAGHRRPDPARQRRALAAANFNSYFDYQRPRKGNWSYEVEAQRVQRRPRGQSARWATALNFKPTYFVSDAFNVYVGVYAEPHAGLAGLAAATT